MRQRTGIRIIMNEEKKSILILLAQFCLVVLGVVEVVGVVGVVIKIERTREGMASMGNTVDTSRDPSSAALPRSSRRVISREQLRAKSFLKREHAVQGAEAADTADIVGGESESYDLMESSSDQEHQHQQLMIEKLELDIQRLSEKCSALESQNILVSVQQLDLFTRGFSYVLSFSVLYLYWKAIVWTMTNLNLNVNLNVVYERVLSMEFRTGIRDTLQPYADHFVMEGGRMVVYHTWFPRVVQAVLLLLPYLYNRWTHGSTHRRFQVFVVAFVVLVRVKMCRWRERLFLQEDSTTIGRYGEACTNDGIWEANYEISARFLYLSILRLRGLWTKTAQYLSSRADFMPVGYIRELSKLQDQAPATEWDEIQKLLPASLLRGLTDIDPTPLASASIGQVHTARLKATGEKVVIKVQHPHARTLMTDDFWSLKVLTRIIGWLEPEYAFMEILMNEWATEARKELDFTFEAQHLREARDALTTMFPNNEKGTSVVYTTTNFGDDDDDGDERVPFQVEVPEPIEELSNRNVLVMSFSEGCRVDDFAEIENLGLSRNAIMDGIAQTFAHFMYCSTIFNGDPHPGNLLVRPGTQADKTKGFTVVVLDWGLAKRLPERKRVAFCQMVYAAATMDYGLLLDSYKTVGLKMKREDTGQSMEDMRFFLRDMAPRDVARKRIKSKMKQDEVCEHSVRLCLFCFA
jgi:predicted unusual protein kinase regulating ubiquinone biosynthesis (AarF/ABC1/UbiB family)